MGSSDIFSILHSADEKVRDLLNIHTMVSESENKVEFVVTYVEDLESNELKDFLEKELAKYTDLHVEIMDKMDVSSMMSGGSMVIKNKSTFPYNIFEGIVGTFVVNNKKNMSKEMLEPELEEAKEESIEHVELEENGGYEYPDNKSGVKKELRLKIEKK
jgi:hypothetical protein